MSHEGRKLFILILVVVLAISALAGFAIKEKPETVVVFQAAEEKPNTLVNVPLDAVQQVIGQEATDNGWYLEEGTHPAVDTDGESIVVFVENGTWRKRVAE